MLCVSSITAPCASAMHRTGVWDIADVFGWLCDYLELLPTPYVASDDARPPTPSNRWKSVYPDPSSVKVEVKRLADSPATSPTAGGSGSAAQQKDSKSEPPKRCCPKCFKTPGQLADEDDTVSFAQHVATCKVKMCPRCRCTAGQIAEADESGTVSFPDHLLSCTATPP